MVVVRGRQPGGAAGPRRPTPSPHFTGPTDRSGRAEPAPGTYAGVVPRYPSRPVPPPLSTNAVPVVLTGMALWLAAGVALWLNWTWLDRHGYGWWLWTCLAGLAVGGAVLGYEGWRRRRTGRASRPAR